MILVKWSLILTVVLTLQTSLVADLVLFDARGDIVLLMAVAAGLVGGPERGAFVGFAGGLLFDLLVQTPFGLSPLAYCVAGYAIGTFQGGVLRAAWWIPVLSAMAGSALGVVAFAVAGEMVGQPDLLTSDLLTIVGVVATLNALLVPPAVRVARWGLTDRTPQLSLR